LELIVGVDPIINSFLLPSFSLSNVEKAGATFANAPYFAFVAVERSCGLDILWQFLWMPTIEKHLSATSG
jgi:hypothetical protein